MDDRLEAMYRRFTWRIYPDGVHILNNVWNVARPLVADWLADTL